jgi:hypothetical protein
MSGRRADRGPLPVILALAALGLGLLAPAPATAQRYHDDDVRRMMIEESLARFGAECPCPYSYAWNGRQCANNSAYMKRQGETPLCYPNDISQRDVILYRRQRGL